MTGPRERISSEYSYFTTEAAIGKSIGFREVDIERDLGRLHTWLNSEHVLPYWEQNDPLPVVRDTIRERATDPNQTLYIGYLDHTPMSYWESYWADEDRIGDYYDARPADQGFHLLIGPEEYLGKGYATPLVRAMVAFQFRHAETDRIVTEPDVRNDRAIRVFEKSGFDPVREVDLPDKTGLLMICERDGFEAGADP
ncbi:GNAT family N-acetyltransferase [Halostagnicola kamekurae]|uniref:Protein N-acetyltransferase, RimJ/RimL family n=1 Tax=Halostagnicola kamekurae TaxID=619731 RepID=A0A1I6PMG8_9EURY|nr:GNAT family N-acetyltransferase [Halostagnicola kamekurae]SFS41384.1 Protein N-acetyltransferase, RimJ/RimL family [Halostagnicola kamekurae]